MITHSQASACFQLLAAKVQACQQAADLAGAEAHRKEIGAILKQAGFESIVHSEDAREIRTEGRDMQDSGRRTTFIYEKAE